jgi:hypothetical protein
MNVARTPAYRRWKRATDPEHDKRLKADAARLWRKDLSKSRLKSRIKNEKRYRDSPEYREYAKRKAKEWAQNNVEKRKETVRRHHENLKNAVINVLTDGEGTCRWCGQGDQDVLTIDHINNDGAAHRKQFGGKTFGGKHIYQWLVNNDYPSGFQVLCYNCNMKKETLRRRKERELASVQMC